MRRNSLCALIAAFAFLILGGFTNAQAQCPALPSQLANGQIADATQVMANFTALQNCINNISPGGSTNSIQYNSGGVFAGVAPLTNGQFIIGSTSSAPQVSTLTAGPGISITNGPGTVTIATTGGNSGGLYSQVLSQTPTSAGTGLSTWLNQGSTSVSDSAVGICLTAPAGANAMSARYMTAPSPPYTITALVSFTRNDASVNNGAGIGWYDGSSKLHLIDYLNNNGNAPYLAVEDWNSTTSWNGFDTTSAHNMFAQPIWLQIQDNGTNVSFAFSQDGANFLQLFSVAKSSAWLGASGYNNIVFFVSPGGSSFPNIATLMSWAQH
ncbi:MAG: hypothetical protein ACLPID_15510 [Beijerinckiaceae bacterium]